MYPKNAASPERVAVGAVVQISDGAVQTSGVSIKVKPQGTTASAGGGTTTYEEGIVEYVPTQAETNYTSFTIIAYKTGCIPVAHTVITTSSATPGTVLLAPVTHTSAVVPTVTTLTNLPAITANWLTAAGTAADFTTEIQTGLATAANLATVAGYLDTEIAAILADTNELQTDWTNGGRLDLILDARASQSSVDTMQGNVTDILADTADMQPKLGTPVTSLAADIAAIEAQTDDIGTAGAGLTAVPWNAAWDAEVQSEVADALAAYGAATATDVTNAAANVSVDEIQVSALADLFNTNSGTTYGAAVAGSVVAEIADNAGGSGLTLADIADAVWDEAISGHAGSGSTGEALAAAGAAGDPWITALPGSYSAGQAGYIVGTNLNTTVSSRASASDLATVAGYLDTEIAAILADTNELQTDWANGGRLDNILDARASQTSVDDLPTNAELATALGAADDATLAAIAALNIPTAGAIADAVCDEALSGHTTAGTVGKALIDTDLRGSRTVIRGTAAGSATTTTMTPSALSPAGVDADQFKGRILIFDNDTTTTALRGQATDITANTAAGLPLLTFTALTTAPASGDTFSIV